MAADGHRLTGFVESWLRLRYTVVYRIRNWRCTLFGHKWGPEQHETHGTEVTAESWRDCERCEAYWETYHHLGARGIVG